jgi:mannose-6-phosphate isomerase-like protein (cupin superfamily)
MYEESYFMISSEELLGFLTHKLPYEQKIVSFVNRFGMQYYVNKFTDIPNLEDITIKVEGMEKYSKEIWDFCIRSAKKNNFSGPVTAHCFFAHKGSPSFGNHTDPDDVLIYCTEGIKTLYVNDKYYELRQGESVFIPADTPHEITNKYKSVMLSIGFERFLVDKL